MTFQEIEKAILQLAEEKKWAPSDPADLAKSIIIESAELLEHFQWDNTLEKRNGKKPERDQTEIAHEVADVFLYLIRFCKEMDIDLLKATEAKLKVLEEREEKRDW